MIKMQNKKSITGLSMLVALSIGVVVFLVAAVLFPTLFGKSTAEASYNIEATGDQDEDGVQNYFDKCKCTPAETDDGCPSGTDATKSDHNPYDKCLGRTGMCPSWKPDTDNCV